MRGVLLVAAIVVLLVVPSGAEAATKTCVPKGAHVVKRTRSWVVSAKGTTLWACLRSVGHKVRLGSSTPDYAISGAYAVTDSGDDVAVRDLRTARRVSAASFGGGACGTHVASLAVTSHGDAAVSTSVACSKLAQVYRLVRGGRPQLAGEGQFDPNSIRIVGGTVTWRGGSAPLAAEATPSSCLAPYTEPLALTSDIRVYVRGTAVYGCRFATGRITKVTDAAAVDPGSLAISGSTLTWTEQGQARSAELVP